MKYWNTLVLILTCRGCSTLYKVGADGVCRAPDGTIVSERYIDPDRYIYNGPCSVKIDPNVIINGGSWWGQKAGTACGW